MAVVSISGDAGCHPEELARAVAVRLGWAVATPGDVLSDSSLLAALGHPDGFPERAWPWLAASVLVRMAAQSNLIYSAPGGQFLMRSFPGVFRVHLNAANAFRLTAVTVDSGMDRTAARNWLRQQDAEAALRRKARFGRAISRPEDVDLALNVANFTPDEQVSIVENTLRLRNMIPGEPLGSAAEAQMLFRIHMKLAEFGLALPTRVEAGRMPFSHPTEQIFADLLDFYRIPWQYEPRSFPLQWDKDGNVTEAFTPDFYLPEFDLYVELTTMKQSLVTRKNHKIKLLKAIYPHINIQVFYQKDMLDLTLKYGLSRSESES
jgi:hypothetical protein